MKFEENLREARKQNGFSQEELAERLDVSRQAVSKWENGSGYPELDKLMNLCDLFHCTLDELLKGDLKEWNTANIDRYEAYSNQMSKAMAFGVFMCISAATVWAYLEPYFQGKKESLLIVIFFIFVTIGVLTFIYFGMQKEAFERRYPKLPKDIYRVDEWDDFERKFRFAVVVSVGLMLIALVMQQLLESFFKDNIANGTFLFMISIAVTTLVYFGVQKSKYEDTMKERAKQNKKEAELIGKVCGVIMLLATMIYLLWGFVWTAWQINWVIYVIGGLMCGIAALVIHHEE